MTVNTAQLVKFIQVHIPDVQLIYLFGSSNTIYENAESDIDVGVLASKKLSFVERFTIAEEIARAMGREVDLIDLQGDISVILKLEVVRKGQRLYCKDKYQGDVFETSAYSEYVDFNEAIQPIIEAIKQRGSIYG